MTKISYENYIQNGILTIADESFGFYDNKNARIQYLSIWIWPFQNFVGKARSKPIPTFDSWS
jgi:hypothetical protein